MSVPLLGAKRLRELLDENDVRPSKALGQNFVIDPNTIRKMVEIAGVGAGDSVLEIGAGAGSLTLGLAATGAEVTAVELDRKLLPVINEVTVDIPSVSVVHADALEFDFGSIGADSLVANLPYNIATQVVLRAAEFGPQLQRMTVMTQREVGERLAADPGSKVYGVTTVLLAYFGSARVSGRVSRQRFYPVPNVDSVIVSVERHAEPPAVDRDALFTIARRCIRSAAQDPPPLSRPGGRLAGGRSRSTRRRRYPRGCPRRGRVLRRVRGVGQRDVGNEAREVDFGR